MKFSQTFGALAALLSLANAQSTPSQISILTPREGSTVGVNGKGWMIDVVVTFNPPPSSASSSSTSTSAKPAPTTNPSTGYRLAKRATNAFTPFLNSPSNTTTFKPGPDPVAPGFVCLVNTSSDPTQNYAGVFQLNAITNSDAEGNILEAYYSWFISAAGFGTNFSSTTVFFLNQTAPDKYALDPKTDPNVITNVATANFSIFGGSASNTTAPGSQATPLGITVFTPRLGEVVGVDGAGWMIDMVIANNDTKANYFAPSNGYKALYHDSFTDTAQFKPGVVSEAVPGLVVLSNTSTIGGGVGANLANLFQINAVTGVENGVITEYWCTWFVGSAFAGTNKPSSLTIYVVNGTAPTNLTGLTPTNMLSPVTTVDFTLSGTTTGSAPASTTTKSSASTLTVSTGSIIFALLAFLM